MKFVHKDIKIKGEKIDITNYTCKYFIVKNCDISIIARFIYTTEVSHFL